MSFTDFIDVSELTLRDRISVPRGTVWVTGTVVELALLRDDATRVRITLRLDTGPSMAIEQHINDLVQLAPDFEETP